ncbi:nitroreductase family protein [[Eubacterium] cellulosolvens]
MDFYEVIRTRRSIRSYKPDSIPEETLNRILEAARIAPSGSNRQPWRFIIVKSEGVKRRLIRACGDQEFIAEAPIIIAACGYDIHYDRGNYMGEMSMLVDVSIAFTHLILAAKAEGLGTCWIGLFDNKKVKEILEIPQEFDVVALTPLGYPKNEEFNESIQRKALKDIVSMEKF